MSRTEYAAYYLAAVLLLGALAWRLQLVLPITGDEPHYLVIAQSLAQDRDLDVRNNYEPARTASYYGGLLAPHAQPYNEPDRWRSGHNIGLAAIVMPGFALAGLPGAVLTLLILFAFVVPEGIWLARQSGASPGPAALAAGFLFLTPPLALYAGRLYPETLAAPLLVAAVRRVLARQEAGNNAALTGWAVSALAVAILPWLHVKFAVLAIVVVAIALWNGRPETRRLTATLAVSVGLLAAYLWLYYGSPLPNAQYAGDPAGGLSLSVLGFGLPGLFLDQEFGLLFNGPVAALALSCLLLCGRGRAAFWLALAAPLAVIWVVSSLHEIWWGGLSFAPRFLVPGLPLLTVPLAAALQSLSGRAATGVAAIAGAGLLAVAMSTPELVLNSGARESRLLLAAGPTGQRAAALLPSFVPPKPGWSERPLDQMTGAIGANIPDPTTVSGVARTSRGAGGTLISYGPIAWRRGDSQIRVGYRTQAAGPGQTAGTLRVLAYDSVAGKRLVLAERTFTSSEQVAYAAVDVRHEGTALFSAPPSIIIEVESAGSGELLVTSLAWHG